MLVKASRFPLLSASFHLSFQSLRTLEAAFSPGAGIDTCPRTYKSQCCGRLCTVWSCSTNSQPSLPLVHARTCTPLRSDKSPVPNSCISSACTWARRSSGKGTWGRCGRSWRCWCLGNRPCDMITVQSGLRCMAFTGRIWGNGRFTAKERSSRGINWRVERTIRAG